MVDPDGAGAFEYWRDDKFVPRRDPQTMLGGLFAPPTCGQMPCGPGIPPWLAAGTPPTMEIQVPYCQPGEEVQHCPTPLACSGPSGLETCCDVSSGGDYCVDAAETGQCEPNWLLVDFDGEICGGEAAGTADRWCGRSEGDPATYCCDMEPVGAPVTAVGTECDVGFCECSADANGCRDCEIVGGAPPETCCADEMCTTCGEDGLCFFESTVKICE